jgi:hypothetical protein
MVLTQYSLKEKAKNYLSEGLLDSSDLEDESIDLSQYLTEDGIVAFVEDILGITPYSYQKRILRSVVTHKRVAVQSLHGVGKTSLASWVILWAITCHKGEVKVVTTASRWLQLVNYLWPEIHKWARQADWNKIGIQLRPEKELLKHTIHLGYNKNAFATSPDTPEGIEGAHAETLLYVFDEAKTIPSSLFDSVEGAFASEGNAYAFVISTPGAPSGRFHSICKGRVGFRDWHVDKITLEEALEAGQVSQEWVENRKLTWGESSTLYINRVLGKFAESGETSLYKLSWIEDAFDRWRAVNGKGNHGDRELYAADVADDGRDQSTLARMVGWVVEYLHYWDCDTMEHANKIMKLIGPNTKPQVAIDANGVGAGVHARLKERRYKAYKFKGSYRTDDMDIAGENKFLNMRSAAAWRLREILDPSSLAFQPLALPPDDRLERELMSIEWKQTGNVIRISDKEKDIRPLLDGKSTDGADTIQMLVYLATNKRSPRAIRL